MAESNNLNEINEMKEATTVYLKAQESVMTATYGKVLSKIAMENRLRRHHSFAIATGGSRLNICKEALFL